jgi:hypothetical protein
MRARKSGNFYVRRLRRQILLANAAVRWWKAKRPLAWSAEMHMENPAVNTTSPEERTLALRVAAWLKEE